MFGVWKKRFRCLRVPIRTKMYNALPIIIATTCLHNYAIKRNNLGSFDDEDFQLYSDGPNTTNNNETNITGEAVPRQIVNDYFKNFFCEWVYICNNRCCYSQGNHF